MAEVAPQRHVVSLEILVNHRDDADGEIASDAAANLEESDRGCRRRVAVPRREAHHRLDAAFDRLRILDLAFHAPRGEDVAERRVFPAGHEDRQVLVARGEQPAVGRVDLVELLQLAAANQAVHEFVREIALALLVGGNPIVDEQPLDTPHGLFFGNARVGDAVEMALE